MTTDADGVTTPMEMEQRARISRKIRQSAESLAEKTGALGVVTIVFIKDNADAQNFHIIDGGAGSLPAKDMPAFYRQLADTYERLKEHGEGWTQ